MLNGILGSYYNLIQHFVKKHLSKLVGGDKEEVVTRDTFYALERRIVNHVQSQWFLVLPSVKTF